MSSSRFEEGLDFPTDRDSISREEREPKAVVKHEPENESTTSVGLNACSIGGLSFLGNERSDAFDVFVFDRSGKIGAYRMNRVKNERPVDLSENESKLNVPRKDICKASIDGHSKLSTKPFADASLSSMKRKCRKCGGIKQTRVSSLGYQTSSFFPFSTGSGLSCGDVRRVASRRFESSKRGSMRCDCNICKSDDGKLTIVFYEGGDDTQDMSDGMRVGSCNGSSVAKLVDFYERMSTSSDEFNSTH